MKALTKKGLILMLMVLLGVTLIFGVTTRYSAFAESGEGDSTGYGYSSAEWSDYYSGKPDVSSYYSAMSSGYYSSSYTPYYNSVSISSDYLEVPYGTTGFSQTFRVMGAAVASYQLSFQIPLELKVEWVDCDYYGYNNSFDYYYDEDKRELNITYSSASNLMNSDIFTIGFSLSEYAGEGVYCHLDLMYFLFCDENANEVGASFSLGGIYITTGRQKGDFDGNGTVNIDDIMYMQRYIDRYDSITSEAFYAGDIDNNGVINVIDCQYIQMFLIGKIYDLNNIGGGTPVTNYDLTFIDAKNSKTILIYGFAEGTSYRNALKVYMKEYGNSYGEVDYEMTFNNNYYLYNDECIYGASELYLFFKESTPVNQYLVNFYAESDGSFIGNKFYDEGYYVKNALYDFVSENYSYLVNKYGEVDYERTEKKNDLYRPLYSDTTIYVCFGSAERYYSVEFYAAFEGYMEYCCSYDILEGTILNDVFNRFISEYGDEFEKRFGEIDFETTYANNPLISEGKAVYGDTRITIYYSFDYDESKVEYNLWFENTPTIPQNTTYRGVITLLSGQNVKVSKYYYGRYLGSESFELTAEMIKPFGDDKFADLSQSWRLTVIYNGKEFDVYANKAVDPNAQVVGRYAYYSDPEYAIWYLYDNGVIAWYQEEYVGVPDYTPSFTTYTTTAYENIINVYSYGLNVNYIIGEETYNGYNVITDYRPGEDDEITDYYLMLGNQIIWLKVFNVEFAELWQSSDGGRNFEYEGTVNVSIIGDKLYFWDTEYTIGEGNMLMVELPDEAPLFVAYVGSTEKLNMYEGGVLYYVMGGSVAGTGSWEYIDENDLSSLNIKLYGMDMTFYRWVDGLYYQNIEPDWSMYTQQSVVLDGETYSLYYMKSGSSSAYIHNGEHYSNCSFYGRKLSIYGASERVYYFDDEGNAIPVESWHVLDNGNKRTIYVGNGFIFDDYDAIGSIIRNYEYEVFDYALNEEGLYDLTVDGLFIVSVEMNFEERSIVVVGYQGTAYINFSFRYDGNEVNVATFEVATGSSIYDTYYNSYFFGTSFETEFGTLSVSDKTLYRDPYGKETYGYEQQAFDGMMIYVLVEKAQGEVEIDKDAYYFIGTIRGEEYQASPVAENILEGKPVFFTKGDNIGVVRGDGTTMEFYNGNGIEFNFEEFGMWYRIIKYTGYYTFYVGEDNLVYMETLDDYDFARNGRMIYMKIARLEGQFEYNGDYDQGYVTVTGFGDLFGNDPFVLEYRMEGLNIECYVPGTDFSVIQLRYDPNENWYDVKGYDNLYYDVTKNCVANGEVIAIYGFESRLFTAGIKDELLMDVYETDDYTFIPQAVYLDAECTIEMPDGFVNDNYQYLYNEDYEQLEVWVVGIIEQKSQQCDDYIYELVRVEFSEGLSWVANDNAKITIHAWYADGSSDYAYPGCIMTPCGDGQYEAQIRVDGFAGCVISRINPETGEVWNRSDNIYGFSDGYTIYVSELYTQSY